MTDLDSRRAQHRAHVIAFIKAWRDNQHVMEERAVSTRRQLIRGERYGVTRERDYRVVKNVRVGC